MKQMMRCAIFFLSCMFFASTLHATAWPPDKAILLAKKNKHKHKKKHKTVTRTYYYYPNSHVYFYPNKKLYYYRVGNQWKKAAKLPSTIIIKPGNHKILNLETDQPYRYFNTHKVKYPRITAYQFYPTLNVYFDPSQKFWFHLSGTTWKKTTVLPKTIKISNHTPVVIEMDTSKPYKYYDVHKVKYKPKNKHKHKHKK